MVTKTRGIVIKYLKYKESSIIALIYTEEYGLTSFMINGIRSPRSKRSIGYFQPFSLLDMVVYLKSNREIQRLSEYKFFHPSFQIKQDIRKSTIILFLAEILGKLLVHEPDDEHKALFEFLSNAILTLDQLESNIENFHLHFLLKLMPYMGIGVEDGDSLIHSMELELIEQDEKLIAFISRLISSSMNEITESSGKIRYKALELILNYYQHHTSPLGEIKSLKVLHQVFS